MIIRDGQMGELRQAAMRQFKDRTVERLRAFAPRHFAYPGELAIRSAVDLGVERAFGYGLTGENAVHFYIEMMFLLGSEFHEDPLFPWAAAILTDASITDQNEKADRLYQKTSAFLKETRGDNNVLYQETLARIRQDFLILEIREGTRTFAEYAAAGLPRMYPQKYAFAGAEPVHALIAKAGEQAKTYGIGNVPGSVLLLAVMFLLGAGVDRDPLHPWVSQTLGDKQLGTDEKTKRLRQEAAKALDRCLT